MSLDIKLYEAVDRNPLPDGNAPFQIAYYDDGVGTEQFKLLRLLGGVFGWGLSRNVRQLYAETARNYRPGDQIFLFGFSRGAFTVRTLAGLIATCGIVDPQKLGGETIKDTTKKAYDTYRNHYRTRLSKFWTTVLKYLHLATVLTRLGLAKAADRPHEPAREFRKRYVYDEYIDQDVPIRFVGVWDTVDAVGFPIPAVANFLNLTFRRFKFPDTTLGSNVGKACHAIAIDDERHTFHPVMWREGPLKDQERIEQVWFPGAHSNVGGGYSRHGLSMIALDWMMTKASECNLRFVPELQASCRARADRFDKVYDSRSGASVYYRYSPRNIEQICRKHDVMPCVHVSALERLAAATDGYAPGNLPSHFLVSGPGYDKIPGGSVEQILREVNPECLPLFEQARPRVNSRIFLSYVMLFFSVGPIVCWGYNVAITEGAEAAVRDPVVRLGSQPLPEAPWATAGVGILLLGATVALAMDLFARSRLLHFFDESYRPIRARLARELEKTRWLAPQARMARSTVGTSALRSRMPTKSGQVGQPQSRSTATRSVCSRASR